MLRASPATLNKDDRQHYWRVHGTECDGEFSCEQSRKTRGYPQKTLSTVRF